MYWNRLSREQVELARNGKEYEQLCAYLNVQFGYTYESENAEDQPEGSHSGNIASKSYQVEGAITKILKKELKFYQAHQEKSTGYPTLYQVDIDLQKIDQLPARFEEAEHAETRSEGSARDKPLTDGSKSDASNGSATSAERSVSQSQPVQDANNKTFTNFEWSRVYIVKDHQAQSSGDSNIRKWYLLDGESTVLHELNARFDGIRMNDANVNEYLDFFCSFLCAEKGSFALIEDDSDLQKLEDLDRFERALFEERHRAVRNEVKPFPNELKFNKVKEEIKKCIQNENPFYPIGAKQIEESSSNTSTATSKFQITRLVLYDRRIFYSTFEVLQTGYVEMSKDRQIFPSFAKPTASGAERTPINFDLAVRRYATFRHRKSGLVLYTKSEKRRLISSTQFREYARSSGSVSYLSNLLVEGDVTFGAGENLTGVECSNLQFLDSILFDHCVVSSVLRFEHCQFLGSFGAPGTRFHSQVVVKHSEIFAVANITPTGKKNKIAPYFALELDSARIDGSLTLECLTAHASVSCKHLTVQSDANLSGIRVLPLVEENWEKAGTEQAFWAAPLSEAVLFDLQRSSFAGSLNLGIWVDRVQAREKSRRRVTVCGRCRFDTMSIGKSLILEGLAVVTPASKKVSGYACSPSLDMPGVTVKGNIQSWDYDSWDPTGTIINPPLIVDGPIDLKWSTIEGYVDFRTSHIGKELDCRVMRSAWLTLEPSRVDAISVDNKNVEEAGEIDWANYSLTAARQPKVLGNTSSDWTQQFQRRMSIVQGNLELGNAIIPGGVTLTGTIVEGTVDVRLGAQLGQVKALPVLGVRREAEKRTVVKQTAFLGRLSIRDSTIAGPVYLWGTRIGKEDAGDRDKAPRPVIDITTSKLTGGLYLHARSNWEGRQVVRELLDAGKHWRDDKVTSTDWVDHQGASVPKNRFEDGADAYFWQTIPDVFHTSVKGDVDILASDLGADLDLTNTDVKGRIRINDSYVKCDVRAVTCLQELEPKSRAVTGPKQGQALHTELKTECSQFEFQSLRSDGDLMLAGLAVAGDVDGRNAVVRGHAEFVHEDREAAIEENLNLCGFEVGLLKIGGKSFEKSGTIDLARATMATLEVSTLPKKINLQSIKVGYWKVGNVPGEENDLKLLDASNPYDSWAYKSLENARAAEGNDDLADKIHRARNRKELAEAEKESASPTDKAREICYAALIGMGVLISPSWPWLACILCLVGIIAFIHYIKTGESFFPSLSWLKRTIWDRVILGDIMGFGTRLFPAFCAWLLLAFSLGVVLSNPRNVQPTFAAVNVGIGKVKLDADSAADAGAQIQKMRAELQKQWWPQEQEWGFWNHGLWLALDITVPLIPFNLHDEWEPKDTTEGTVFPCCSYSEMPVAPKTLANWFVPASWIIWTLIATGMAGVIRTRN